MKFRVTHFCNSQVCVCEFTNISVCLEKGIESYMHLARVEKIVLKFPICTFASFNLVRFYLAFSNQIKNLKEDRYQ